MMMMRIMKMMVDIGADFEDVSGDSLVSALPRGAALGYLPRPVRAKFVGMSQAVWLFGCLTYLAFGAHEQEGEEEEEEEEEEDFGFSRLTTFVRPPELGKRSVESAQQAHHLAVARLTR